MHMLYSLCCVSWEFLLGGKFQLFTLFLKCYRTPIQLYKIELFSLASDPTTSSLLPLPPTLHPIHLFAEITSLSEQLLVSSMDVEQSLLRLDSLPLVPCRKHLDGAPCGFSSWVALSLVLLSWDRRLKRSFSPPPMATVKWKPTLQSNNYCWKKFVFVVSVVTACNLRLMPSGCV